MPKKKLTKNQRRRLKRRQKKLEEKKKTEEEGKKNVVVEKEEKKDNDVDVVVEYVVDDSLKDSLGNFFNKDSVEKIFGKFTQLTSEVSQDEESKSKKETKETNEVSKKAEEEQELSNRKRKLMTRMTVAELKQVVAHPEVVDVHDVNASDPRLLIHLKSYRNSVPVPRHWSRKRKYLQGKRGIEKPPFKLPDFIEATGISKMRSNVQESDEGKSLRQKARERMNAKMGKIDIDYAVLYTAFFKNQTKPPLTGHGELYYESKEFETDVRKKHAGILSPELKEALGMPNDKIVPVPWLLNMQRYGPPPSYPKLKIPGLNSPIPAGASFGYHPGGWGKPPVNEFGQALYGDVFGTSQVADAEIVVDKSRWGELVEADEEREEEEDDEEDEEEEEEKEEEEEEKIDETGFNSVMTSTGYDTPSTTIELRKGIESVTSLPPNEPKQLYTVLEQKTTSIDSNAVYGSDRRYVIPSNKNVMEHVDVALDPSELEGLSEDQIKAKYEEAKESGNVVKAPTRKRKSRFGIRPDAKRARKEEES